MNRTVKQLISALFILLIIFVIAWLFYPAIGKVTLNKRYEDSKDTKQEQVYIQSVNLLKTGENIEYKIPSGASGFKIVTNALFYYTPGQTAFPYEIQLEILNDKSEVIFMKHYFHKGLVRLYKVRGSRRIVSDPFMVDMNRYLTKNYEVAIPVESFVSPSMLRIKMISGKSVIVRAAYLNALKSEKSGNRKERASYYPDKSIKSSVPAKWRNLFPLQNEKEPKENIRLGVFQPEELIRLKLAPEKKMFEEVSTAHGEILNLYLTSAGGEFKAPSKKSIASAEALFLKLFNNEPVNDAMVSSFNALGFDVKEVKTPNNNFIVICEQEKREEGKGFYIFCRNNKIKRAVLEIPHRFFDAMTGMIGYKLMMTGNFTAGAWNTVYRYQTPNLIPGSSDMAHNKRTFFNAFTRAFARSSQPNMLLLQIHGYTVRKHLFSDVNESSAVLSAGTSEPSDSYYKIASFIKNKIGSRVLIYPKDASAENLSAKENAAIDYFQNNEGGKIFIHFEMDELLREKFMSDKSFMRSFSRELSAFLREFHND